jgi:branched-chain amino acid transport system substrate-binding protein
MEWLNISSRFAPRLLASTLAALSVGTSAWAQSGETVKIAFIDPLSGSFANIGQNLLRTWQTIGALPNAAGVKYEMVPFDNKASPQESLNALKAALDQGIRYVAQGNGSGAAAAISDAVTKHNERNPGKEVVFLNYAAVDPALTNERCSYWHFRFDADTSMKMEAMAAAMQTDKAAKNVYFINQNYAHGQQVAKYGKESIARRRPDIKFVGDELHPLGQVKDFAPYVAKIKQSGADTVVTGNWGADMALLFKSAKDAGLNVNWYTYYAGASGTPSAMGTWGDGKVRVVYVHQPNLQSTRKLIDEFKEKHKEDMSSLTIGHAVNVLAGAMAKAKSSDPMKVAKAMEGLTVKSFSGDVTMRVADHQLQQTLYATVWKKKDAKNSYDVENTGMTWAPEKVFEPYVSSTPTSCQMKRPA